MTTYATVLASQAATSPVPHDFPHPICVVCQFPIPAYDLGGNEFQPRHASTCVPDGRPTGWVAGGAASLAHDVHTHAEHDEADEKAGDE